MATTAVSPLLTRFTEIADFLKRHNVERDEDIDLLLLSTVSGVDALFLGDPGTGKTWMIELLVNRCLTDMKLFSHLFAKDQSADEVLGPRDIMAMKAGKIARLTDGYMPSANYAYADEVFKASPPMLNPLLDLLANRVLKVGGQVVDCGQLISILMSSNELPDREDLLAFRDRIGITKFVQPVKTPEGRRRVTDIQLDFQTSGLNTANLTPLTLDEIKAIREDVKQIVVNEACREIMVDAQQKWMEAGHPPSQRRIGQMWKVIKAHAWVHCRDEVVADDFLPCQHMAWNHPDDAASAREVVLEFASVFTRKAERAREALEPIIRAMEELRPKLEAAQGDEAEETTLMSEGFKLIRQARSLGKDVSQQIRTGKEQGQDVSLLVELSTEIKRIDGWAQAALTGTDDEE
jgi:MoxR-like ATPase